MGEFTPDEVASAIKKADFDVEQGYLEKESKAYDFAVLSTMVIDRTFSNPNPIETGFRGPTK